MRKKSELGTDNLTDSVLGVGQSIAASFFFVLAGYVILKMSESCDILLGRLNSSNAPVA